MLLIPTASRSRPSSRFVFPGGCRSNGILRLFDNNATQFEEVARKGDAAVRTAISALNCPDGGPVVRSRSFANAELNADNEIVRAELVQWVRNMLFVDAYTF
jgi:hypothetical protein